MTDREKVIKGLECCVKESEWYREPCRECPYGAKYGAKGGGCIDRLLADTIALLKVQELDIEALKNTIQGMVEGQVIIAGDRRVDVVRCKDCKHYMTIHCTCDGCCISDDWFCADGERKTE